MSEAWHGHGLEMGHRFGGASTEVRSPDIVCLVGPHTEDGEVGVYAVIPQVVLLLYFQLVEWVPMYPWNDLSNGNPQAPLDLAVGVTQVALIAGTANGSREAIAATRVFYGAWSGLQVVNWWVPYFFGADEATKQAYARHFGRTHKFLPPIADHPVPDSNHVVLHLLLAWTLVELHR